MEVVEARERFPALLANHLVPPEEPVQEPVQEPVREPVQEPVRELVQESSKAMEPKPICLLSGHWQAQ